MKQICEPSREMAPKWILGRQNRPPIRSQRRWWSFPFLPAWTEFVIFSVFLPLAGSASFAVPTARWIWNWNQTGFVLSLNASAHLHRFDFGVSF